MFKIIIFLATDMRTNYKDFIVISDTKLDPLNFN